MLTLGPDVINSLYLSLFLPNIHTGLWGFIFSNHLLAFYWSHQRVRHFTRSPHKVLLLKAGIRAPRQQTHFQTKWIWKFIVLAFQNACVFCQGSKHGKTKKNFSLMERKRLWTFYWFKIQRDIMWRAEFESHESRKKKSSRINITYEVVFPK